MTLTRNWYVRAIAVAATSAGLLVAGLAGLMPASAQQARAAAVNGPITLAQAAEAARRPQTRADEFRKTVNENVVTIISGNPNGSFLFYAYDIAAGIGEGDDLRVLPIVGRGGADNVRDILYLRGIDMGITQSNTMTFYKKTGELGGNLDSRLTYVTSLFVDEMHIAVRADSGIKTIKDLAGKRLNFSDEGSGTQLTTRLVLEALGIKAIESNMGQADAFEKMRRGELDATVCVCGKTIKSYAALPAKENFRLVSIPYSEELEQDYLPATLTHAEYPNLIPQGETIETIGITTVLAAYNWPRDTDRYTRVANFVQTFFSNFDRMKQPPRLDKWKSVNLAAEVKGWRRFPAAQEWLDKNAPAPVLTRAPIPAGVVDPALARAQAAAAAPNDPAEQERLFREFMRWMETRKTQAN